jgi:hypothetical protein
MITDDSEASIQILSLLNEILLNEKENKNIYNILLGLGNLVYNNENNLNLAKDMDIVSNIKELKFNIDEHMTDLNNLKSYFINILK